RDWSSDVCSSDLGEGTGDTGGGDRLPSCGIVDEHGQAGQAGATWISPQWMAICVFVAPSHSIVLTRLDSYIDTQPAVFIDSVFAWRKIAEPLPGVRASLYPMTWAYLYGFGW